MKDKLGIALGTLIAAVLLSFLLSYPLMLIWNQCLVPATSILKEVTWLQMWGIKILINIMFKLQFKERA